MHYQIITISYCQNDNDTENSLQIKNWKCDKPI